MKTIYLSIEQAVARLINCDYIPEGFALLDITAALLEDAEGTYELAKNDGMASDQLELIACWAHTCEARHTLAQSLMESLQRGMESAESDLDSITDELTGTTSVTFGSLNEWAALRFGIRLHETGAADASIEDASWEDIKIKIYKDYRIGFQIPDKKFKQSTFQVIGLMGACKKKPNNLGGILIGLSHGKKYPGGRKATGAHKTAICKLRESLRQLTGLTKDPFIPFNAVDGWKPRFELIDDRLNADVRAKNRATTVTFDENRDIDTLDYEDEDDDAANFLKGR